MYQFTESAHGVLWLMWCLLGNVCQ